MSRLPIRIYGDACLTQVAEPVGTVTDRVRQLADDMCDTMYDAPGRGLAAPQVGESLRMFVFDCHWKDNVPRCPVVMIDPRIVWASDARESNEEGCLSIPEVPLDISRPAEIRVVWIALDGSTCEDTFAGIEAVCIQHEYDHLDGVLIPDRATAEDRARVAPLLAALEARGGTA